MQQLPRTSGELWIALLQLRPAEELVPMVFRQLEKDLERSGMPLPFSADEPPMSWIMHLRELLKNTGDETIRQLLYIIDVPEQLTDGIRNDGYFSGLAEAILYRELVKLYFKLNYSA